MNVSLGSWLRWSQSKKIQYLPLVEYKYQVVQNLSRTSSSHSGLKLQKSPSKAPVSLFLMNIMITQSVKICIKSVLSLTLMISWCCRQMCCCVVLRSDGPISSVQFQTASKLCFRSLWFQFRVLSQKAFLQVYYMKRRTEKEWFTREGRTFNFWLIDFRAADLISNCVLFSY